MEIEQYSTLSQLVCGAEKNLDPQRQCILLHVRYIQQPPKKHEYIQYEVNLIPFHSGPVSPAACGWTAYYAKGQTQREVAVTVRESCKPWTILRFGQTLSDADRPDIESLAVMQKFD